MTVFVISDTHFGHKGMYKFKDEQGKPIRPFSCPEEADEIMVDNWNRVVTPRDKVYHLGDVAFGADGLSIVKRLNGQKRLVMGNHDMRQATDYLKVGFLRLFGARQINGVWLTHIPMHTDSVDQKRVVINVHGHLHTKSINHPKYFCACVEQINYTPKPLEEIVERMER